MSVLDSMDIMQYSVLQYTNQNESNEDETCERRQLDASSAGFGSRALRLGATGGSRSWRDWVVVLTSNKICSLLCETICRCHKLAE
jgi:hypothetical protein